MPQSRWLRRADEPLPDIAFVPERVPRRRKDIDLPAPPAKPLSSKAPYPYSALRKAKSLRAPSWSEKLAEFVTGGMTPTGEPGPVDLLLAASGLWGAGKLAKAGLSRLDSLAPKAQSLAIKDPLGLKKGPQMGRREFVYRAAGGPRRMASPMVDDLLAKTMAGPASFEKFDQYVKDYNLAKRLIGRHKFSSKKLAEGLQPGQVGFPGSRMLDEAKRSGKVVTNFDSLSKQEADLLRNSESLHNRIWRAAFKAYDSSSRAGKLLAAKKLANEFGSPDNAIEAIRKAGYGLGAGVKTPPELTVKGAKKLIGQIEAGKVPISSIKEVVEGAGKYGGPSWDKLNKTSERYGGAFSDILSNASEGGMPNSGLARYTDFLEDFGSTSEDPDLLYNLDQGPAMSISAARRLAKKYAPKPGPVREGTSILLRELRKRLGLLGGKVE